MLGTQAQQDARKLETDCGKTKPVTDQHESLNDQCTADCSALQITSKCAFCFKSVNGVQKQKKTQIINILAHQEL